MRKHNPNGGPLGESLHMSASDTEKRKREEDVDEALAQSFPASDPPSSTGVHTGPPSRVERAGEEETTTKHEVGTLWLHEDRAYAVVTWCDAMVTPERSGLSHAEAMMLAEEFRREGQVAGVMHVVGNRTYEVDRYPCR